MHRCFALILFLLLPVAGPMAAEDPLGFVKSHQLDCRSEQDCFDKYFLFRGKPVDARLIYELHGHLLSKRPSISSVYLEGEPNQFKYADFYQHDWEMKDGRWPTSSFRLNEKASGFNDWRQWANDCDADTCWFAYTYFGRTNSGVHVLVTEEQTGGATIFPTILLLKSRKVRTSIYGEPLTFTSLDIVGKLGIGWPHNDYLTYWSPMDIAVIDDRLIISPGSLARDSEGLQPKEIDLSGL